MTIPLWQCPTQRFICLDKILKKVEQDNKRQSIQHGRYERQIRRVCIQRKRNDGRSGHVLIVDSKGREVADYRIDQDVVNIAANDDL